MLITIEVIRPENQRYKTAGDWQWDRRDSKFGDSLYITVGRLGDERYEFLVALHELIEAYLCKENSITQEQVDEFDKHNPELDEPGESPMAPYYKEHMRASIIERIMAQFLDVDWLKYEDALDSLHREA